jgi:YidC/Oxa1 family membrane protein insertase
MTGVSTVLVLVWVLVFKPMDKKADEAPAQQQAANVVPTANPSTATAPATAGNAAAGKAAADQHAGPPAPPSERGKPVETTFEQPGKYRATFTSEGAAAEHFVLLDKQYKEDNPKQSNKTAEPIDLVRTRPPILPLETKVWSAPHVESGPNQNSPIDVPPDAVWTEQPRTDPNVLVYTWEDANARLEKRIEQVPGTYQLKLRLTIENKTDHWLQPYVQWQLFGYQDPNVKQGGMFSKRVSLTSGVCYVGGKVKRGSFDDLVKKPTSELGDVRWIAIAEQYFLTSIAVAPADGAHPNACTVQAAPDGTISALVSLAARDIKAKGKTEYEAIAFMGPKILSQLDAVTVAGQQAHLGDVIDYGWLGSVTEWLSRPMLVVLKAIHYVVRNWGLAIIVLTILIKLVTFIPTQQSMKSMKAMAKLKPEMDKLRERFGNDKNQLNLAMMELYKKHGVNPLGGCLPILIQMPVYIALYSMLGNSVELYRSPFVGWIRDLTAADPYFVLPVLTGALMFLQQKTQPTPPDPQQKTMMYLMPVMFTAFSIFLPAGLTIYILTNTILTFLQQWWLNRHDKPAKPKAVATKPARA